MYIDRFLRGIFLSSYQSTTHDLVVRKRVASFMYFILFFLVWSLLLAAIFIIAMPDRLLWAMVVIIPCFGGSLIALMIFKRGHYYTAAHFFCTIIALSLVGALMGKIFNDPQTGFTTYLYFMIASIVIYALFCKRGWVFFLTSIMLAGDIIFFLMVKDKLDPPSYLAARVGVLDSAASFVLVSIVATLFSQITNRAIADSERESREKEEQYARIKELLTSVQETATSLVKSSDELNQSARSSSDTSQNQAASMEEIMATVEEVSAGVENVTDGTIGQNEAITSLLSHMEELSKTIVDMSGRINDLFRSMREIASNAEGGSKSLSVMESSIGRINESSREMTNIVEIITGISTRINLLSLNAAIEAARAGDAGRGFGVVADEISKLADQTATSIKEIDSLIKVNGEEMAKSTGNINNTIATIGNIIQGIKSIDAMTNELLQYTKDQQEINGIVNREAKTVQVKSEEIRYAAQEQKGAVDEIVRSITNINELTQVNASSSEKMMHHTQIVQQAAEGLWGKVDIVKE
jgi:methyl-accepting chemotaxis protein